MPYSSEYSEDLTKKITKIKKKNRPLFEAAMNKIDEILQNPERDYKNLRHDLSDFKRVHIMRSFVLIFKVNKEDKIIRFEDLDHHDKIYKKRF